MKRLRENMILYSIVFFTLLIVLGCGAIKNIYEFKVNGKTEANYEGIETIAGDFAAEFSANFPYKTSFVDINGLGRRIIGQREMNLILKLNNGHLITQQWKLPEETIKTRADEVINYARFCERQGKPILYVQPFLKIDANNKQLPIGIEDDYSNENIDEFLKYIYEAGIEVLDIRQCLKDDDIDMYDYTYVTDHHWTTKGCFYAFTKIVEWIEQKTGIAVNASITDINQYDITTYPKWHLGSSGQRTGQFFAGIDDYDLITPKFDVVFVDSEGNGHSFYEQVVNTNVFEMRDPTNRYTYDRATRWPDGIATTSQELSVLFVTDSYATAMVPFIKLAYSNYLNQYYPAGLNGDYVIESDPDVVILMPYYSSTFSNGVVYTAPTIANW